MTGFDDLQVEIRWSNSMNQSEMLSNNKMYWIDDNNKAEYRQKQAIIQHRPDLAGLAIFGDFGGYEFIGGENNRVNCKVKDGVKGMGFPAWAVFDHAGNGVLFY